MKAMTFQISAWGARWPAVLVPCLAAHDRRVPHRLRSRRLRTRSPARSTASRRHSTGRVSSGTGPAATATSSRSGRVTKGAHPARRPGRPDPSLRDTGRGAGIPPQRSPPDVLDDEETPSVEQPLFGDFFCAGECKPRLFTSPYVVVNHGSGTVGYNAYFPMPFRRRPNHARVRRGRRRSTCSGTTSSTSPTTGSSPPTPPTFRRALAA